MNELSANAKDFLSHYGVKGMRWGVSRTRAQLDGRKKSPEEKAVRSERKATAKARRLIPDSDIDKAIERLSKEKKLKDLTDSDLSPGRKVAKTLLSESGQKAVRTVVSGALLYGAKLAIDAKFGPNAASYIAPKPKK